MCFGSVHKTMLHLNYTNSYVEFGSGFGALERDRSSFSNGDFLPAAIK
jgi:hypothetical protein